MIEISEIYLAKMDNGAHFSYHTEMLTRINANSKVKAKLTSQLSAYQAAIEKEDAALVTSRKSFITDEIATADSQRDALYLGLKNAVKAFLNIPDTTMQEAARILAQLLKDYRIEPAMQLDRQTGLMTNLITDLEGKCSAQVAALSLAPMVAGMKTANEKVRTSLSARTKESSTKETGMMKAARLLVDEYYREIVKYINAYALLEGAADYQVFIDVTNAEIVRYKRQVLKQKAKSNIPGGGENGDEGEPENPFE
ncbi:DUF6261 family protein [Bacteroides neonati]|uniref:DUF6261 family protein n=1 Tax=Bacteroides neonati TaxID=1347393 RepID=UPI000941E925|nr:DUF6261 family protein [Bacteroides neonati]